MVITFLICVLMFAYSRRIQPIKASPGNIWVPYDYPSIQAAIFAANPGDHIHVVGGTYYEHILVNKSLTLIGEGEAIIDGGDYGIVVRIAADGVMITNFTIQNAGSSILSTDSGIYIYGYSDCNIINNRIKNGNIGIYGLFTSDLIVSNNEIADFRYGVYLFNSSNNIIETNKIESNKPSDIGILLSNSNKTVIRTNTIANTTNVSAGGITLTQNSSNNTIYKNNIINNFNGMTLDSGARDNKIYYNSFINNTNQVRMGTLLYNQWDIEWPYGGNYWSTHTSPDNFNGEYQNQIGSDGICDQPYYINPPSTSNIDRYPLMAPIGIFDVWLGFVTEQVSIISNSTISNFQTNMTQKIVKFNATGEAGVGFCRVDIPNTIVSGIWQNNYTILVDGEPPIYIRNWTHGIKTYIYFTYQHSTREIIITPEFPSSLPLIFMITTLLAIIMYKRKYSNPSQNKIRNFLKI